MNDIQKFRQRMAERGYEYTMEEAEIIWNLSSHLVQSIERLHSLNPDSIRKMTVEEKEKVCEILDCSMIELEMYLKIIENLTDNS